VSERTELTDFALPSINEARLVIDYNSLLAVQRNLALVKVAIIVVQAEDPLARGSGPLALLAAAPAGDEAIWPAARETVYATSDPRDERFSLDAEGRRR
jgi:hypothetical protein